MEGFANARPQYSLIRDQLPQRLQWLAVFEWISQWVFYSLRASAFFRLLAQTIAAVAILTSIVAFLFDYSHRQRLRLLDTWDRATDRDSSHWVRRRAVLYLYDNAPDLAGIDLSESILTDLHLTAPAVNMPEAKLRHAEIHNSDFSRANLKDARFKFSNLINVNLTGANLGGATFQNTQFTNVDVSNAIFGYGSKRATHPGERSPLLTVEQLDGLCANEGKPPIGLGRTATTAGFHLSALPECDPWQ